MKRRLAIHSSTARAVLGLALCLTGQTSAWAAEIAAGEAAAAEESGEGLDDPGARQPQPLKMADGKPYLDFAFAEMKEKWGGVNGYLAREIGLSPRDIVLLRARYTD